MTVIYPGSFDPVTLGHMDVINRASRLFTKLIVAVMDNKNKKTMFDAGERAAFIEKCARDLPNIDVRVYSGLLTDFFKSTGAAAVVRGVRGPADFDFEITYAQAYKTCDNNMETLLIPSLAEHAFVSSGMAREVAMFGGDLRLLLPDVIIGAVIEKFQEGRGWKQY